MKFKSKHSRKFARRVATVSALTLLLALSGCGLLSGSGPRVNSIEKGSEASVDSDYPYKVIDLNPSNIADYLVPKPEAPNSHVTRAGVPPVRLGPGDVLKVVISDDSGEDKTVFAPLSTGGTIFDQVPVDSEGYISLPYMGRKHIAGDTLNEAANVIRNGIKGSAGSPQVYVEFVMDYSGSVLVSGAVKSPGRFSPTKGPLTLIDAINDAGGPSLDPYLITVHVRTGQDVRTYNYQDVLSGQNIALPANAEVVLDHSTERFVALGAVSQPGLHDFTSPHPNLLEVLGSVGGLNDRQADPSGVFVFRLQQDVSTDKPEAKVFRLDMRNPVSMFLAKTFLVHPGDAIYVTNSPVYEMEKIIAPIVQVMVLGESAESMQNY